MLDGLTRELRDEAVDDATTSTGFDDAIDAAAGTIAIDGSAAGERAPAAVAAELGVDDILVFERVDGVFRLIGGAGRGAGWAGLVELLPAEEPHLGRAWRVGIPVRIARPEAVRIAGPYWAREAVVVPVGHEHVVVLGSTRPVRASDAALVRGAARAVAGTGGLAAEKLLADELELVHAIRALTAYRPESVRDTIRHVALVAARALDCEVAAVRVDLEGRVHIEALHRDDHEAGVVGPDAGRHLEDAASGAEPIVEQGAAETPRVFSVPVVSRLTLPLGRTPTLGAMTVGHAVAKPRGFTLLCQRIGLALAEAAELVITQAYAREQLASERDLLHRLSRTDGLTGLGNRLAWEEAVAAFAAAADPPPALVISADVDGLKAVNDRLGHTAGDAVIRMAAGILRSSLRDGDLVSRVGGDEFLAICPGLEPSAARRVAHRIGRMTQHRRGSDPGPAPEISIGWAAVRDGDVRAAVDEADARMYAAKRRRARQRPAAAPARGGSRRPAAASEA